MPLGDGGWTCKDIAMTWRTSWQRYQRWPRSDCHWPDDGKQNGSAADEVHQKQHLLPQVVFTRTLLSRLDDDVGHVSQDLKCWPHEPWQTKSQQQKLCLFHLHTPGEEWRWQISFFPCPTGCTWQKPSQYQLEPVWWTAAPPSVWEENSMKDVTV